MLVCLSEWARTAVGFTHTTFIHNPSKFTHVHTSDCDLKVGAGFKRYSEKKQSLSSAIFYRPHTAEDRDELTSQLRKRTSPTLERAGLEERAHPKATTGTSLDKDITASTPGAINVPIIVSLFANQFAILTFAAGLTAFYVLFSGNGEQFLSEGLLNWTGNVDISKSYELDFSVTPGRLLQGCIGAVPTIAFSNYIANSDDRRFATTNFSTIFMVMTLFGLRDPNNFEKEQREIGTKGIKSIRKTTSKMLLLEYFSSYIYIFHSYPYSYIHL